MHKESEAAQARKMNQSPKPPSTRDLIIARFQGPLISASMEKTMKLRLQYLGAEHPDTLKVMINLAEAWHRQQRYMECDGLRVQVLDASRNKYGDNNLTTIIAMERLGATRSRRGYDIECEKLEAQALQLRKVTEGRKHPETVKAMTNLGATWLYLDRNEIAESSLASALRLSLEVLGEKHENTIHAMVALGEAKRRFGNYEDAQRLLERAYELGKELLGEGHVHTLAAQSQLARTWGNDGKFEKAEALHRESIEIHQKCLGERHPNTCASRYHFAETLFLEGRYEEAEEIMAGVAVIRRQVSGVIHPYTRRDANFLAEIRSKKSKVSHFGTVEEIFSDEEELIVIGNQVWHLALLKNVIEALQRRWRWVRRASEEVKERSPVSRSKMLFPQTKNRRSSRSTKLPTSLNEKPNTAPQQPSLQQRGALTTFETLLLLLLALILTYGAYQVSLAHDAAGSPGPRPKA